MALIQTTTNYSDRDVDLLIFQGVKTTGESKVALELGSQVCSGIQKVAQTFAILFLTDKGSNPWDANRGTDFMNNLRAGYIQDENSLQAQFGFSVVNILDYIETRVNPDTPDDEVLVDAELVAWDLRPPHLSITVRISTLAGESRVFVIPTSVTI